MRKINKKILVAALSLLLVACAFVTILSFTMAADGDPDEGKTVEASPSFDVVTIYNIDRIIQNSIDGDDPYFHIVEITSGSASAMSGANTDEVFTEYVFNGHATIEEEMAAGLIDYKVFSTGSLSSDDAIDDCVKTLAKADLIYVHNDSASYFGQSSNDIPELVKLQLCSAAVGDYVPFIIDGPIATQEIIGENTTSYQELATKVFKKYGGKKATYSWDPSTQNDAKKYFTHETSLYVQIDGKNQKDKWTKVYGIEDYDLSNLPTTSATGSDAEKIDTTKNYVKVAKDPATIGRILVINNTAADGDISTLIKDSITPFTGTCILEEDTIKEVTGEDGTVTTVPAYTTVTDNAGNEVKLIEKVVEGGKQTAPPIYNDDNVKLYSVPETSGLYNAYITRNNHPDYMSFEYYASNDAALDTIDYSLYDIVIVEKGANLKTLSTTNYDRLVGAMNASQHILYDKALIGTTTNITSVVDYGDNYDYVCGKVMTSTESSKYDNVLVTNNVRMNAYMAANNAAAVDDIATIINYASYRGIGGGNGDSSNTYTVLEIQPAYPIDTKLAAKFAKIDGTTHIKGIKDPLEKNNPWFADQLTFAKITGRTQTLTVESNYMNTANNSWYYIRNQGVINNTTTDEISFDGETSLTTFLEGNDNITSSQLSMVTDYYAWTLSKAKIAHATGLAYNQVNVVHMSTYEFNCTKKTLLDNFDAVYIGGDNSAIKSVAAYHGDKLSSISLGKYNMYFTNGDAYDYNVNYGSSEGSVGTFIGNDITDLKYKELVDYKNAGMPIIVGKDAVAGLTAANAIDPDSNMYKFLLACRDTATNNNILWNFNYDDKVKIANTGEYGDTFEGYATVFNFTGAVDYKGIASNVDSSSINEDDLRETLNNSSQRPKLVITKAPVQYKEGDRSTWITDHNLVWTYEAAGGSGFTARLIFDDNSNSRFDDDPVVRTETGKSGTLAKKMDADFFGVIYWKLEVENDAGLKASTTGCIKIARTNQEKIHIDVLQIMPDEAMTNDDNSEQSLFLCTECQQRRNILKGNVSPTTAGTKYTAHVYNSIAGDRRLDTAGYGVLSNTTTVENNIKNYVTNATNPDSPNYVKNLPTYGNNGILDDGEINEFEYAVKNNLGIHDHRFGIVKYDSEKYYGQDSITNGVDDWNTNWFTDVKYDYDVNLEILTLDEYEAMIEYTEDIYRGMDTSDIKTERSKNEQAKVDYYNAYKAMMKVINGTYKKSLSEGGLTDAEKMALQKFMFREDGFKLGVTPTAAQIDAAEAEAEVAAESEDFSTADDPALAKTNFINAYKETKLNEIRYANFETVLDEFAEAAPELDKFLNNLKGNAFGNVDAATTSTEIEYELSSETYDERPYYDMFSLINTTNNTSSPVMTYCSLYATWRDAKLYEQYFRKMYQYFKFISAVDDAGRCDLSQAYNCMLFGAARNFAGADIDSDEAIDAIIKFVDNGGQAMLFYDTLTADSTVNMTNRLGPYFGVNTYSEPVDTSGEGTIDDSTATEEYKGTVTIKFGSPYYSTWDSGILKEYVVDTAATEVNVVINANQADYIDNTNLISITDNKTEHEGNYGKHDIKINVTLNNSNQYSSSPGITVWVNGEKKSTVCNGVTNGTGTGTVKFSNAVIKEEASGGSSSGSGSSGPLALNPNKLTYRTGLEATTPGTNKSGQFNYMLYFAGGNASDESKTHPAKPLLKQAYEEKVEANAADQNNEGIVTMYPFSIGSNLRISPTVESDLTLKVNDPDLIVYYSLSGGTGGTMSTPYVADPHDGANNYFVYQYQPGGEDSGMVTYLGAGCTMVTGTHRENNDERRFFINLILNTGRKSTKSSSLDLYDHSSSQIVDSETGKIGASSLTNVVIMPDGNGYKMYATEDSIPEFSMLLTADNAVEISHVYVYYDLDYNTNSDDEYHDGDGKHIMVYSRDYNKSAPFDSTNPTVAADYLMYVDQNTALTSSDASVVVDGKAISNSMLRLKGEYIEPYNNEYTYLVVKVVPTKGNPIYKRIKIIIKPQLFDLT
ncbi:MAG: DUF5057 domain-containing protein [Eubacterium sp.]|nr:DUF5057 domain-containing protein [Eubacterium sp.]